MGAFAVLTSNQRSQKKAGTAPTPAAPQQQVQSSDSHMNAEFMAELERRLTAQEAGSINPLRS